MNKTGRSWQVRITMAGTLQSYRIDTMRSISTSRQKDRQRGRQPMECGATLVLLRIRGVALNDSSR
jgi:hypothetical protein